MTSRRGFLGIFAATPLVAPAMAKEALAPYGVGSFMQGMSVDILQPSMLQTIHISGDVDTNGLKKQLRKLVDETLCRVADMQHEICGPDVPNRLAGATINHEGDAV